MTDKQLADARAEIKRLRENSVPNWIADREHEENSALNILVDDLKAELERRQIDWSADMDLAYTKIRRYEAVVQAARLFLINMWDADVDAFPDIEQLRAALAALDSDKAG